MSLANNDHIHKDHRKRVKEAYIKNGTTGMADHNLLEMLLFYGIPYKDTNEIAHDLINHFGSFSNVFLASIEELKNVKGMTENAACLINMMLPVYRRFVEDSNDNKKVYVSTEDIVNHIKSKFIGLTVEKAYVLCFDSKHRLIMTKKLCEGDISSAAFNLRLLTSTVLETNARSIVLVHNHPNGFAMPSVEDKNTTKNVYELMRSLKVKLEDHIIFAGDTHISMLSIPLFAPIFYGADDIR